MKSVTVSLKQARRMALKSQLLHGRTGIPKGKEGVAQTIEALGYVQIDTISVVERAHHHTLWTRRPDYDPAHLHALQAKDRRVFEYWAHEASYVPMRDYRFYRPLMLGHRNLEHGDDALNTHLPAPRRRWAMNLLDKHGSSMQTVLKRVREEGPKTSKDFERPGEKKASAWWGWKPAKAALELLFWRGDLMITERRNFHRVYDLTERVLPGGLDVRMPDNDELGRFQVRRALAAFGLASVADMKSYLRVAANGDVDSALKELVDSGEVVGLRLRDPSIGTGGSGPAQYYALSEYLEQTSRLRPVQQRVRFLSPFDNLVIGRKRALQLFDFNYTLECYVPASKRKYGYFSLPVLWGEQFVARLDAKAYRKKSTLILRNLVFEEGFQDFDTLLTAFGAACIEFARFNSCADIIVEEVRPARFRGPLRKHLRSLVH